MQSVAEFLCTELLQNIFYQFMKFKVDSFYSLEVMAWTKAQSKTFPSKNDQRAITLYRVFYEYVELQVDSFDMLGVMVRIIIQSENIQMRITRNERYM